MSFSSNILIKTKRALFKNVYHSGGQFPDIVNDKFVKMKSKKEFLDVFRLFFPCSDVLHCTNYTNQHCDWKSKCGELRGWNFWNG